MGRRRKHDRALPQRVYLRRGKYYYVRPSDQKWIPLGKTEPEMLRALAQVKEEGDNLLAAIFDRYESDVLPAKAPKTARDQKLQLANLRETFAAFTRPELLRPQHVAKYLDEHPAKVMANREVALLSHVFKKAIRWGLASTNPCTGVERNAEDVRRYYVEDFDFWMAWAYMPLHIRALMELAYLTGQRQEDVLSIRVTDLRPTGIYVKQRKTGNELIVGWTPLLRDLVDRLRAAPRAVGSVWLLADAKGQRYTLSAIRTAWGRVMLAFPFERFQFRDIRKKSANDHETGRHLGHREKGTLAQVYRLKPTVITGLG
jgi:integrase